MAPSGRKGRAAAAGTPQAVKRSTRARTRQSKDDGIPDVYAAMLSEANTDGETEGDRPLKKRKLTPSKFHDHEAATVLNGQPADQRKPGSSSSPAIGKAQTVEDSSESDGSEFDFEDVRIDQPLGSAASSVEGIEDLSISVQPERSTSSRVQPRRKPIGTIEKTHRLLVHKLHVLCLMGHCMFVNGRCNNATAQRHLQSLLSPKTISYLNPPKQETQFQRNRSFMDGLGQAVGTFTADYRIIGSGLKKPRWNVDGEAQQTADGGPSPVDSSDFIAAAQSLEGSQDMANQLFCTMLRSVGVDARIVCSLQALPFSSVPKAVTPKKSTNSRIMAMPPYDDPAPSRAIEDDAAVSSSRAIGKVPSARRRLGQPNFATEAPRPSTSHKRPAPVVKLAYPVFWVEAFNEASQKWVAVDPIVTHTIGKPAKIEPPASYEMNQLTYAMAFEDDGSARDVTRRYAKAYNAKTRRHRVEAAIDGTKWWKRATRVFQRSGGPLDRDQVEDAELAQKEAREGLPANVLDFKDHPYYALERHLRRHEVINPKREVGKVNAGTAAKPRMEPVFRRRDVIACKSADKWYRSGREIKAGEQPLKHVPARKSRQISPDDHDVVPGHAPTTALYAPYQTQQYVPPPVHRGRIPKNMYGNLDIYVPTMIPAGGVHIRHTLTQQAARLLRIDYADAVTGFQFKGRHGTAVVEGAVVAEMYADAVQAVIEGMEYEALESESRARSLRALKAWKRFLTGLRISERVRAYGDTSTAEPTQADGTTDGIFASSLYSSVDDDLLTAGLFSLKELERAKPPARKRKAANSDRESDLEADIHDSADEEAGGLVVDDYRSQLDDQAGFLPDVHESGLFTEQQDDGNSGGGFLVEEATEKAEHGGGFVPEDVVSEECRSDRGNPLVQRVGENATDIEPEQDHVDEGSETELVQDQDVAERSMLYQAEDTIRGNHSTIVSGKHNFSIDEMREGSMVLNTGITEPDPEATVRNPGSNSTANLAKDEETSLQDDQSDKGSMLSHDPSDDEAEPDWLESD